MVNNIVELVREEVINRSNKFEEETKYTRDEYNLYKEHVQYVYKYAVMIAKEKNVDLEIVELSALLHDISMTDSSLDRSRHNEYSMKIAEEILLNLNYQKEKIDIVKLCILNHSSKRRDFRTTVYEQILVDADAMAHFDSVESIYSLAYNVMGLTEKESMKFVREKLTKDYEEISDDVRKFVSDKYNKILNIK